MRAILVLAMAVVTAGCATGSAAGYRGPYGIQRPKFRQHVTAPAVDVRAVTGRWDNVMMLPRGQRVVVLRMDGGQAEGDLILASARVVRLVVAAGEVEIPAEDVARVDRVLRSARRENRILSGLAHGVGLVSFAGLVTGFAPPLRLFAAGAMAGAEGGAHDDAPGGAWLVYLAPELQRR